MSLHISGDLRCWIVTEHGDDSNHRSYKWDHVAKKPVYATQPRVPFDRVRATYTSLANAKRGLSQLLPARTTGQAPDAGLTAIVWQVDFGAGLAEIVYVRTSADVIVKEN